MDIKNLEILLVLDSEKHFKRASEKLNISQKKIAFSGPVLNLDVEKIRDNSNSNITIGFQGGSQGSKEINDLAIEFAKDPIYENINLTPVYLYYNKYLLL